MHRACALLVPHGNSTVETIGVKVQTVPASPLSCVQATVLCSRCCSWLNMPYCCCCCCCVFAGSSLGGWLALQLALDHPALLIAPALDFTEAIWAGMTQQQQATAQQEGRIQIDSK